MFCSCGAGGPAPQTVQRYYFEWHEPGPLDLNRATAQELTTLPGIGEVLAQRIVDYREAHGPFRSVEELIAVEGIGEGKLEKLRELVTVEVEP